MKRCSWCEGNDLYIEYHDIEWGLPVFDDKKQFEFLVLESAQAGLSWLTILKKREGYRKAYLNFNPVKVAKYSDKKIEELITNPEIIRNRKKIEASVNNARCFLDIQNEFGSFCSYIWSYTDNKPIVNKWRTLSDLPAKTDLSDMISKDLKNRGFRFLGSTTIYAHMQAVGMVNDHLTGCFRHKELINS